MPKNQKIRLHKLLWLLNQEKKWDYTRPEIARNIENFGVLVDGERTHSRLEWVYPDAEIQTQNWPKREKADFHKIQYLYQDENLLAIYKPVNTVVEAGSGHTHNNLLNFLQQTSNPNLNLIHRLDKDTEGVLLLAKNSAALEFFQAQFRQRTVQKKYLTLLEGCFPKTKLVENYQTRDPHNPLRQKSYPDFQTGQEELVRLSKNPEKLRIARSLFKPVLYNSKLHQTLVEVQIFTGRMHQIRLQAENLGYPVANDTVYNQKSNQTNQVEENFNSKPLVYPTTTLEKFEKIKKTIFQPNTHYLLSNYIKLKNLDKALLEIEIKNLKSLTKDVIDEID